MGTTRTSQPEVEDVAMMDRLESMALLDLRESNLYSASPLHLHGLPLVKSNYASFESLDPLVACPDCKVRRFIGPTMSLHKCLFTLHAHIGSCDGDGRYMQPHEVVKLSIKR
jgi:hypothetical protein